MIACVGDGAMQMNGLNALITVARHWEEWKDPRFIVLVLNNRDLNQVTWEQRVMAGDPKNPATQDVPPFSYARFAENLGLRGVVMRTEQDVVAGWREALGTDRPVVVDAHTDPEVPPLPPHITPEQARKYLSSMLAADPHRWRVVEQSVKQLWAGVKGTVK